MKEVRSNTERLSRVKKRVDKVRNSTESVDEDCLYPVVGVKSNIKNAEQLNIERPNCIFVDCENTDLDTVIRQSRRYMTFPFIFRSSYQSYHVIDATVNSVEQVMDVLEMIEVEDSNHRDIGYIRGDWVLRTDAKADKNPPRYITCVATPTDNAVFSKAHLDFLKGMYGVTMAGWLSQNFKTVESKNLDFVRYMTHE